MICCLSKLVLLILSICVSNSFSFQSRRTTPIRSFGPSYITSTSATIDRSQKQQNQTLKNNQDDYNLPVNPITGESTTQESVNFRPNVATRRITGSNVRTTTPRSSETGSRTFSSSDTSSRIVQSSTMRPYASSSSSRTPSTPQFRTRTTSAPRPVSSNPMETMITRMASFAEDLFSGNGFNVEKRRVTFLEHDSNGNPIHDRLIEIVTRPVVVELGPPRVLECTIIQDSQVVKSRLNSDKLRNNPPKHVTRDVMESLVSKCNKHQEANNVNQNRNNVNNQVRNNVNYRSTSARPSFGNPLSSNSNKQSTISNVNNSTSNVNYSQSNVTSAPSKFVGYKNVTFDDDEEDEENEKKGIFNGLVIYPGTKWCGAGTIAKNDSDLGSDKKTDSCCREHDKCDDSIKAGETKYNLTNSDQYTKSACRCDEKFAKCLKDANSFVGHQVGRLYFNVIQIQCFKEDYPIKNCTEKKGFIFNKVRSTCQDYELDETKPRKVQFFDPPFYDGDSGPLFNIPILSDAITKPINFVKNRTINGGIVGSVIG